MNLKRMLEEKARVYRDKTAVSFGDRSLSYAELDSASNRLAHALIKMGVRKGDRIALLLPNSLEYGVIYFGVAKTGGIAVPLDVKFKPDELASLFHDCQPKVLIAESPCLEPLAADLSRFKSIEQVIEVDAKHTGQFHSYADILAANPAISVEVEPGGDDAVHIGYTSGPTSHPRGVVLSHRNIIEEIRIAGDAFQQTEKDITMLFALPMHHVFGLIVALLSSINNGGRVIILPGLSISGLMEVIERERGTIFMGVPYVYALAVNMAEQEMISYDLSSLRLCSCGGASLPDEVATRFKQYYGLDIVQLWGLTEATAQVTCSPANGSGKLGSAGKLLPGWELKIVDNDARELPRNQPGEIIVSGPIMKEYYRNPQATAQVIKNGWLHTGDIGRLDADGYLFITGRKKKMIIVKGQNIYPMDVEEVLRTHPQVDEVTVVGVPDEQQGEIIRAIIKPKRAGALSEEEVRRFCRQHLANYKVPRQVVFLDSPPGARTG